MTTKKTNIDYYEKDWNDLEQEAEASLEEKFGLDLSQGSNLKNQIPIVEDDDKLVNEVSDKEEKDFLFTPLQLEKVVKNAQLLDDKSIRQLYEWFKPLIWKASHRYTIYTVLGEDAENIAWNIFYDFIYHYKGDKFGSLPGLLKKVVNYRLMDAAKSRANYDPHIALDEFSFDSVVGVDDSYWDDKISDICLAHALSKLCKVQSKIIKLVYFEDKLLTELVNLLNKPYHKIRYNHSMALSKLKEEYLKSRKECRL